MIKVGGNGISVAGPVSSRPEVMQIQMKFTTTDSEIVILADVVTT